MTKFAMPVSRTPTRPPAEPNAPSPLARTITSVLIVASLISIFGFAPLTGRELALPDKLTMAIIGMGTIAGFLHLFGVVPEHRQLRAFASPIVAWPMMLAGMATLITS